jgi:hypothetical protein
VTSAQNFEELYYRALRSTSLPENLEATPEEDVDADKTGPILKSEVEKAIMPMRDKKGSCCCPQHLGQRWSQPNDTTD